MQRTMLVNGLGASRSRGFIGLLHRQPSAKGCGPTLLRSYVVFETYKRVNSLSNVAGTSNTGFAAVSGPLRGC